MKRYVYTILTLLVLLTFTSCLKGGLEDFPLYEDADITSVSAIRHRYYTDEKSPASGELIVREADLSYDVDIDSEAATVNISVSVPSNFPGEELDKVSVNNLVVVVSISTAARIFPLEGSPYLGVPGNWSKTNSYLVQAADGTEKIWKITVDGLD